MGLSFSVHPQLVKQKLYVGHGVLRILGPQLPCSALKVAIPCQERQAGRTSGFCLSLSTEHSAPSVGYQSKGCGPLFSLTSRALPQRFCLRGGPLNFCLIFPTISPKELSSFVIQCEVQAYREHSRRVEVVVKGDW